MKHFFFSYNTGSWENGSLNSLFEKHINLENTDADTLKALYDAADTIYDKRLERADKELLKLVNGNSENNINAEAVKKNDAKFYELLNPYRLDTKDGDYYRIRALKILWNYVEQQYKIFEHDRNIVFQDGYHSSKSSDMQFEVSTRLILYHLVRGNICLRISQCYYENYDLKNSDIWSDRAIEILWHGKNLAARLRDTSSLPEKNQADLYLRLIKLNLAKYYRDYARKNRRSDFDAALDEFKQVRQRVEDQLEEIDIPEQKRQYVLIWMDALFNIVNIHRRKYQVTIAEHEMLFFYYCLKQKLKDNDPSFNSTGRNQRKFTELIKEADKLAAAHDNNCQNDIEKLLEDSRTEMDLPELCIASFENCNDLHDYDRRRYLLLILLELSRICRDLHFVKNYSNSVATAIIADQWSFIMDCRPNYTPGHNIDALITISSSLRKYFKFQTDSNSKKKLINKIQLGPDNAAQSLTLRTNDGTKDSKVSNLQSFIKKLNEFAKNGHLKSKTEIIKWHCLYQQYPNLLEDIQNKVGTYNSISKYLDAENLNLQLYFLKGLVYLRSGKYVDAIELFQSLTDANNKETQYVRLGTIGLKARYSLANCYMALAEYSKAEKILEYLHKTLADAKKGRERQGVPENTDADPDARVEIDLGYCYMQRGIYEKALNIYEKLYGLGGSNDNMPKFNLYQVKQERRIMGLNNYAACCIFSINDRKNDRVKENMETARKIFFYMDNHFFKKGNTEGGICYESDPETNLLKGYFTLCTGVTPEDPITDEQYNICLNITAPENSDKRAQSLLRAHKYFREACRYETAFTPQYDLLDENNIGNKAKYRNEVERISVYIINLTKLYKLQQSDKSSEITKAEEEYMTMSKRNLERFLLSLPTTYKISLKAAIALAEWLLDYEKTKRETSSCEETPSKADRLVMQMYRSFSYITIYEERGAQVFNVLRDNSQFRFFTAAQRGKLLALLLAMYKPIKAIKEECCFNISDNTQNLVHYTSIENLKKLLTEKTLGDSQEKDLGKEISSPHFRINNCGYMNDVFEGNVFLKGIALVSGDVETIRNSEHSDFIKKYFPQLNRSYEDMLPSGSNVYIGSLSVKEDSFPMWSVYGANELGCNIQFGDGFFDIDGIPYFPRALRDYMLSKYTDQDYPLYIVQYIGSKFEKEYQKFTDEYDSKNYFNLPENEFEIMDTKGYRQSCETESICYQDLFRLFKQIYGRWKQLDEYLEEENKEVVKESQNIVRAFASDRINEIRFLFKNADYEFEGEVRVVYTDSADNSVAKTDTGLKVPHVYVDMDREIEGLTVRLGSRISDTTVDKYVTWLKHTKRIQKVVLAKRNRYTT